MNCSFVWKQSVSNIVLSSNCSLENSLSPSVAWLCLKDKRSLKGPLEFRRHGSRDTRLDVIAGADVIPSPFIIT